MNNNLDINDRILYIIDNQVNGNQKKFSELIGFAPQVISNIVSGRRSKPSFDVLNAISSSFVDIDSHWLLTGNGSMLKNKIGDNSIIAEPTPSNRKTIDPVHDIQKIPLYNITATMGLIPTDGTNSEHLIDFLSIPNLPLCDGAMYAMGDSMYPLLKAGDIVVYKKVDIDPNTIFFGEIYVLSIYLDSSSTMKSIKYIQKSDKGEDYIKLVSVNQHHSDKDIPLNKIAAMALVRAHIRIHN